MGVIQVITSVRNTHGIKVKRSCLSCRYKDYDEQGCRFCSKMMLKVGNKFRCSYYEMSEGHKLAGTGWGRVKSKEYLKHVLDSRNDESEAIQMGTMNEADRKNLLQIKQEYMEKNGSIYCLK